MNRTNTSRLLAGLFVLVIGAVALAMGGAALIEDTVSLSDPDNQTIETNAAWSGPGNVTVSLESDGSVVESTTVSGTDGDIKTVTLDPTGLQTGEYTLVVDPTTNVSVDNSTLVTEKNAELNATANETVAVDVGFDASETTNATVTLSDGGTTVNSTELTFDPVEYSDGSDIKTWEYELSQDVSALNVTIETTPASGHSQAWLSLGSSDDGGLIGAGGIIAGASRNQILGFLAVMAGIILAIQRDLI